MINKIQIQNFKSVVDLSLDLGTFNVLIGANGSGKSNILEGIAFGAAANADKLDYEFLGSRGIRVTNPELMFSAFVSNKKLKTKVIRLDITLNDTQHFFELINDSNNGKKWIDKPREEIESYYKQFVESRQKISNQLKKIKSDKSKNELELDVPDLTEKLNSLEQKFNSLYDAIKKDYSIPEISSYIIYSPEQTSLRRFEETDQIYPLGIKGEGLFQYLRELSLDKKNKRSFTEIKDNLNLIDWFEDFELPKNLLSNEYILNIKDKYLNKTLQYFDQRSTNEGFLYLLFYSTLFISKLTPTFFAIDNIDASLNPKLCMQLTKNLASLAKKHKKQVIVTTQNPAILDGLNLKDDNQRLFVVRRNEEGHTKAQRIMYKAERTMKLSEIWTNGFIGGLPDNF